MVSTRPDKEARAIRRLTQAKEKLGNKCVSCDIKVNLEFDHIDRTTKKVNVSTAAWTKSEEDFWKEISKCQLMCRSCHLEKCKTDGTYIRSGRYCGTVSKYQGGCRCDDCVGARLTYDRERREKKKRNG